MKINIELDNIELLEVIHLGLKTKGIKNVSHSNIEIHPDKTATIKNVMLEDLK